MNFLFYDIKIIYISASLSYGVFITNISLIVKSHLPTYLLFRQTTARVKRSSDNLDMSTRSYDLVSDDSLDQESQMDDEAAFENGLVFRVKVSRYVCRRL